MLEPSDREVTIFSAARQLPAGERAAYLDQACAGDAAFRDRVEDLLLASEEAGTFLQELAPGAQRPVDALASPNPLQNPAAPGETVGHRIGRFKLLQQIGEGGCGVVYMAEQEEPVRRRVALKVIKLGMDTQQVIARFEAERQALALMDHPNIAKVLDGGATSAGRPFFVMELVRGVKITEFCDQNNLTTRERLGLFIQVCQAIQHAHQKGIIHRDIKPSNILVTLNDGVAVPKVIDFGIAKATQGRLTDHTVFTAFEQFVGTPAYMSPEQAVMTSLDVDTRSDTYSLGVLLYELLTGRTPFDAQELMASGLEEMRRTIREQEPPRPSTRLSTMVEGELTTTAKRRQIEPFKLVHLVRGDLDWIVMKCLEKDRARRYETANGLAMDLQRYLADEPVVARPPSNLYRLQKLVRRNKLAFAAAGAVGVVLVIGVVVSMGEAFRATRAEREQTQMRQKAERAGDTAKHQEQLAHESAEEARRQQRLASEQELLARRSFYAAQISLANQAVEVGQLGRALQLLETQRPKAAAEDLRTFEWYYLWGLCNGRLRLTLRGHQHPVFSIAISPDGKTLASGDEEGTIRLWDTSTGRERFTLKVPAGNPVDAVAFTPDGRTLAAGNEDGLVRLWDSATGKLRATLPGHGGWVRSLAISPDGSSLLCGRDEGVITLFDLATQTERTTLPAHKSSVLSVGFSRDGRKIASASGWGLDGGTVRLWDLTNGLPELRRQLAVQAWALAFSPDGKRLATASWDKISLWETTSGQLEATLLGHLPPVHSVAWLPDGQALVSCAADRTVRLWPMLSTINAITDNQIIGQHLDAVTCLAISADGTTVASGANDGSVKLWNLTESREEGQAQVARSFQMGTGSTNGRLNSLSFSSDGNVLFGSFDQSMAAQYVVSGKDYPLLSGPAGRAAFSPDGKLLATGDAAGTVQLWDRASGRLVATVKGHNSEVAGLAFSPDSRTLATCGFSDPELKAWAPGAALNLLWKMDTQAPGVSALEFSPDGRTIAVAVRLKFVVSFDAATGQPNSRFNLKVEHGYAEVLAVAYPPDGNLLATGSQSGTVKLWNLDTGRLEAALQGHTAIIHAVAFSPDGASIATGSEDQTVRLWDVVTGQERITLHGFQDAVSTVIFSPDGNTLAAGSNDGMVRLLRARRVAEATAYSEPETATGTADAGPYTSFLAELAMGRLGEGKLSEAESFLREDLNRLRKLATSSPTTEVSSLGVVLHHLAEVLRQRQALAEARSLAEEALAMYQRHPEWPANEQQHALGVLAAVLTDMGDALGVEALFREALVRARNLSHDAPAGEDSSLGVVLHHLAEVLRDHKQFPEARSLAEEAAAMYRRHPDWPSNEQQHALAVLGDILTDLGDVAGLEALEREQLVTLRSQLAPEDPELAAAIAQSTMTLLGEKKFAQAEPLAHECLTIREKKIPDDWRTFNSRSLLGGALLGQEKYAQAEPLLLSGFEGMKQRQDQIPTQGKPRLKETLERLVRLYEATGRPDQAAAWKKRLTQLDDK